MHISIGFAAHIAKRVMVAIWPTRMRSPPLYGDLWFPVRDSPRPCQPSVVVMMIACGAPAAGSLEARAEAQWKGTASLPQQKCCRLPSLATLPRAAGALADIICICAQQHIENIAGELKQIVRSCAQTHWQRELLALSIDSAVTFSHKLPLPAMAAVPPLIFQQEGRTYQAEPNPALPPQLLGAGAYGRVYLYRDTVANELVAVKRLQLTNLPHQLAQELARYIPRE